MKAGRQTTLGARATVSGIGVHSGKPVSITFHPADAGTGVVFVRLDAQGRPEREVRAHAHYVAATELATVLGDAESGPCVSTIEHIMAALCGLGVDNAIIEIDGAEAPIMDGSAAAFVAAIDQAGIVALGAPRRFTKVLKPIRVQKGDSYGELTPYERGFRVDVTIDFPHAMIGQQSIALEVEATAFRREVARARTFGFMKDVSRLWAAGYGRGASTDNTLVLDDDRLLNPEGLRFRRRVRAAQGARCDRRSRAGRRAAARRVQVVQGRPPDQSCGPGGPVQRPDRLDGDRGEGPTSGRPARAAMPTLRAVAPAYRADLS